MKREINVWEYAGTILEALGKGILMTTKADGITDTMTIGWGKLGIEWGKPIFIAYVRESRYTKELVEKNPEFTINVPYGAFNKEILGFCGTKSGRDVDKFAAMGLTTEEGQTVSVPAIKELPLTLECKVIYQEDQNLSALKPDLREHSYPAGTVEENNFHTAYYGEITAAYIVE